MDKAEGYKKTLEEAGNTWGLTNDFAELRRNLPSDNCTSIPCSDGTLFTMRELGMVLRQVGSRKTAPGKDGITKTPGVLNLDY